MKVLVIDNYDSFVYNLVHLMHQITALDITIVKNDGIHIDEVAAYDRVLLSPGPGLPHEAGMMPALIRRWAPHKPILGVCLGHQAIAESFGGKLRRLQNPLHGVASEMEILNSDPIFNQLPNPCTIGHYHSWVVDEQCPGDCMVTATSTEGFIMAIRHPTYPVHGFQFHPESILTPNGKILLTNWLNHLPSADITL